MSRILVVTCPGGNIASHILPKLYHQETRNDNQPNFSLRLAAHSQASVSKLATAYPKAEIHQTDLSDPAACIKLLQGATSVFHIGPSLHFREKEIGLNMVDAALAESKRAGNNIEHFVFSSVLGTQHRSLMQHDLKSYVEERLMLSPIKWTILQPTNFMDMYPVALFASQEAPVMERFFDPASENSLMALRDLADVGAKVLLEGAPHYFAQYPLCSTMPVSDYEVAEIISGKISRTIEVRTPSLETGVERIMSWIGGGDGTKSSERGVREDIMRDEAARLCLFYNHRGLVGSPNVMRWLLGREPTSVAEWVDLQLRQAKIG